MNEDHRQRSGLLEAMLSETIATSEEHEATRHGRAGWLAEVIDERHPALLGRVRVTWTERSRRHACWLPCLCGLAVRTGDRVLVQRPAGATEPIVVGVLDGYEARPAPRLPGPSLELRSGEALTVHGRRGRPLLQIHEGDQGPVIHLLGTDVALAIDGTFSLSARAIRLRAEAGDAELEARDDVIVRGELIHLN